MSGHWNDLDRLAEKIYISMHAGVLHTDMYKPEIAYKSAERFLKYKKERDIKIKGLK